MHLTPTCSITILAHGIGINKKNQVNNLKDFNILRVGFSLRIDSVFIDCATDSWLFVKSERGIYLDKLLYRG